MIPMATERSWLFDPNLLKLVHQCRRLIHSEFGVKLHLTDDHLEKQLADYANRSRSGQLRRVWDSLKHRIPGYDDTLADKPESTEGGTGKRIYRGQVIETDARPTHEKALPAAEFGAMAAPKKKVIYRGQVIG